MKKQHLTLTSEELEYIAKLLSKDNLDVRLQKRALGLKKLHMGMSYKSVSDLLKVSYQTVLDWGKKYRTKGLDFLQDKPRSGRPVEYSKEDRAKITALAYSSPPKGYARWTLRLLRNRVIELGISPTISHTEIGRILKKNELQSHRKK